VHRHELAGAELEEGRSRLLGIEVLLLHEPGRTVAADRKQRGQQTGEAAADLGEAVEPGSVAGVVDALRPSLDDVASPQRAVGSEDTPPGPVARRDQGHDQAVDLGRLPPLELHHRAPPTRAQPPAEPGRRHHRHLRRQRAHGTGIEVVEVVVRDEHRADRRQCVRPQPRWRMSPVEQTRVVAEHRIDQEAPPAERAQE